MSGGDDDAAPAGHDPANGKRSRLLHGDWVHVEKTAIDDFSTGDFAALIVQAEVYRAERRADEVLRLLSVSRDDPTVGYPINNYRHCLQSATLALRAGKGEDYVVAALLHDIGYTLCPESHGPIAAALVGPYLSPELEWMLAHHDVFEDHHRRNHPTVDGTARERFRGHPAFVTATEFVALFDQDAFDPDYDSLPLEAFVPMVRRIFANPPRQAAIG